MRAGCPLVLHTAERALTAYSLQASTSGLCCTELLRFEVFVGTAVAPGGGGRGGGDDPDLNPGVISLKLLRNVFNAIIC